ncbi:MAG TPA: pantoate--beta-alanine ligase [Candidatus Acidoferrum sp.]|nr:pantoate--beta-alanine ligase [Candidatus Acidoferrum sp.]
MRIVRSVGSMQRLALAWRRAGLRIGLVPTMGYLHAGHLSLISRARHAVGRGGKVVVSIYVNPTQFGPREDFSRYPRDFARDVRLCREATVDVIFAPTDTQMYPRGNGADFSTFVVEQSLALGMEGKSRPTHFRGVTTVVAKLFNIAQPDVAVFGAKDWQQAAIIRRMVRDLNFPVRLIIAPILREPDGLAMSSRNKYLTGELRPQALALWRSIQAARRAVRQSRRPLPAARLKAMLRRLIERQPAARVDYVEFFQPDTLAPVRQVRRGTHLALAVFVGKTRLIDNAAL